MRPYIQKINLEAAVVGEGEVVAYGRLEVRKNNFLPGAFKPPHSNILIIFRVYEKELLLL